MGKSILITGASSGIGRALALEMARRGYALGLAARRTEELDRLREEIRGRTPSAVVENRFLDVTAYDTIPTVIRDLADALGGLDIVFANAGIAQAGKVGRSPFDRAIRTVETNLIGAMATVDAATACFLEKGGGHIVGTSSIVAYRGVPNNAAYSASKAGFTSYLETLRAETLGKGIDVTVLHPGFIDTPLNDMLPNRPFLVSVEKGAAIIADLIERRVKSSTVPPYPWGVISRLLAVMPARLIARM